MRILTANIRYYDGNDGRNHWNYRKELCVRVMLSRQPDIICTQETSVEQFSDLRRLLPDYDAFGIVDTTTGRNPQNAIFYRREVFALISAGGYWLSETPHVTGSSSWGSACIRLLNWLRLEEKASGNEFRVLNTHLDHVSQKAREEQGRLIVEDAFAYPEDYPQILAGDMNANATNPVIHRFKESGWRDTYETVHGSEGDGFTWHNFEGEALSSHRELGRIDWIFVRGGVCVEEAEIVRDMECGRYPSDHYFVYADIRIEGKDL